MNSPDGVKSNRPVDNLIWAHFGVKVEVKPDEWSALDGQALRGIEEPGERVLLAVSHTERQAVAQNWLARVK